MHLLFSLSPRSGAALALLALAGPALAADHNEADGTKADHVADLDDVYAWHTSDGKIVAIVTFGGPGADAAAVLEGLDDGVVYGIHVDDDGDYVADHDIWVRFGQNGAGAWGVEFTGIPGGTATVSGPIQTEIDAGGGLRAIAGVFDDPFFFDFTGLQDTLATGAVSFQATRDSFAGKNVNAIVLEMSTATATGGAANVNIWATTGRK